MTDITATYSPEDNKLRLYASTRLDAETFGKVKGAGYKWAPKQELFVAPKWTPAREDLALELAGEIEPESMTMAERAEIKSERLAAIAENRKRDAETYARRADELSECFSGGQPILMGHHSQRKAEKTAEKMRSAQTKANDNLSAIGYWLYKAESVQRHANYKNSDRTRARRIKTLLTELRDVQRRINENYKALDLLERCTTEAQIRAFVGGGFASMNLYLSLSKDEITPQEAREQLLTAYRRRVNSSHYSRWTNHILGRLSYERTLLGRVTRFGGTLTPAILQTFARTHGADKPKATAHDGDRFTIESPAPLPLHIASGHTLDLDCEEWRDLMESVGYEVPAKKAGPPPILNFKAEKLWTKNRYHGTLITMRQVGMTKAEYKEATRFSNAWIDTSYCGQFRFKTVTDPHSKEAYYMRERVAVFLTDSKAHTAPEGIEPQEEAAA